MSNLSTQAELNPLANIIATARGENQGCPAAASIETAMTKYQLSPPREKLITYMELVATVACHAGSLPQGAAPALDWIAETTARIARKLRAG